MSAHNYDGDMLTDEVAQVHRSPGFITSNLIGKAADGRIIKEFEASHGTVADLWYDHLDGKETSFNPLGMIEALIGAMDHAAHLKGVEKFEEISTFTQCLRKAMHVTFRAGEGTRDMSGPSGLTTEQFIDVVARRLGHYVAQAADDAEDGTAVVADRRYRRNYNVDQNAVKEMFVQYDTDGNGTIDVEEFQELLVALGVAPLEDPQKRSSASSDKVG